MNKKNDITYLTIEKIGSGLFESQIISPLISSSKLHPDVKINLVVVNYFWLIFSHKKYLSKLRKELRGIGVGLRFIPFLIPPKFTLKSKLYCSFFLFFLAAIFRSLPKTSSFHCRGYFTTLAVLKCNSGENIIFDMRSLWVSENIAAGNLVANTPLAAYWSELEKQAISKSCTVIGVSEPMGDYARGLSPDVNYVTIPIAADTQKLAYHKDKGAEIRERIGFSQHDVVAVYSGSFGLSGINIPSLVKMIKMLDASLHQVQFLILSGESESSVSDLFFEAGLGEDRYRHMSVQLKELGAFLSAADFGIHALPRQLDSSTRLGTKVVEYWANQLPVVISSTVGAAAEVCMIANVGLVVDLEDENCDMTFEVPTREASREVFDKFDIRYYDTANVSNRYAQIYRGLSTRVGAADLD